MGIRQLRFSDVTDAPLNDEDAVTVTIKGHAAVGGEAKVFDTSLEELKSLKTVDGLIELEVRHNGSAPTTLFATKAEFAKFVPDDKVKQLPSNRGRRPGFSPSVG